jgi:hypothetical protein
LCRLLLDADGAAFCCRYHESFMGSHYHPFCSYRKDYSAKKMDTVPGRFYVDSVWCFFIDKISSMLIKFINWVFFLQHPDKKYNRD